MLVSMKHNVLADADDRRPKRRGHRSGIVVAAVALLALGTASGAVALAVVPQMQQAAPAPSATAAPSAPESTPAAAPVVETPEPAPTPPQTGPVRRPYDLADPGTWTITGTEVGPIAFGGPASGELDDVDRGYARLPNSEPCRPDDITDFDRPGLGSLSVLHRDGAVSAVSVHSPTGDDPVPAGAVDDNPSTPEGMGIGSTLDELRQTYPDIAVSGSYSTDGSTDGPYSFWTIEQDGRFITFQLDAAGEQVNMIWVASTKVPPMELC
ncbi:hypothetical protein DEI83_08060 [Curtobacterium sp. MCBD17_021]|nr:hypothetical protein DEI83_08060 [Curtobacterium sp. MCBD17_021]